MTPVGSRHEESAGRAGLSHRARPTAPAPHEIRAELASLLATAYLRLTCASAAPRQVREMEASASGELQLTDERTLSHVPVEPSCDGPAESPPAWSST